MTATDGTRPFPAVGGRLAIVAGGGALPRIVYDQARAAGHDPVVVAIADGMADPWEGAEVLRLPWSRTGDVFGALRRASVTAVIFCGTISVRPDYRSLLPSLRTLAILPEIFRIVRGGDDSLLRAVGRAFERRGFLVLAVQDVVPRLLTPPGPLGTRGPSERESAAVERAAQAARRLGELDVGQAAVASADRVIALEGIEGTREMLARVADLRARGRIGRSEKTVLFKACKPQQDPRFDLPSVGVETVAQCAEAGVSGIALTARRSLLVGLDDILAEAHRADLFLVGHENPESRA